MKKPVLFFVFFVIFRLSYGQNLTFYGFLPAINQTGPINKKLSYNVFASTTIDAFKEKIGGLEYPATDLQFYFQPSLIYMISPKVNVAGSYTYQRNNPFNNNFVNEHRLWQQAIFSFPVSNGKITARLRVEERFIENRTTQKYPLFTRLRQQIGWNKPLQGKVLDDHEFYLNMYNEFYFSVTGNKNATYSENWSYVGVGYQLGKLGKIEVGNLFQVAVRNKQQDLRFLELGQITWITNFK